MKADRNLRLCDVVLDETIGRSTPDVEHERAVAIFDLLEENLFEPVGHPGGPYRLNLSLVDAKLVFAISTERGGDVATHILSYEDDGKVFFFEGNYTEFEADRKKRLGEAAAQPHRVRYKKLA